MAIQRRTNPNPNPAIAKELLKTGMKLVAINNNPFLKEKQKLEKALELVCGLSEEPFQYLIINVLSEMKFGDKQFASADLETESVVTKYPRLAPYKSEIRELVVVGRQKTKLEV
jgi:hypothetical protein